MLSLNPYLVYNGDCEAAFNFYNVIFGAEALYLARYKEVPQEARKFFPNAGDEDIMHGTLIINKKTVIMGNDSPDAAKESTKSFPRDFYLYVDVDSSEEAIRIFEGLTIGGRVLMPIAQTFWSPCYGIVTDRFGITWKITSH